jgi:hypothetical protein
MCQSTVIQALSASLCCQPFLRSAITRQSVSHTRWRVVNPTSCVLLSTTFLYFCQSPAVVRIPPTSIVVMWSSRVGEWISFAGTLCLLLPCLLPIICYEFLLFCFWVLVFVGSHFFIVFVMTLAVLTPAKGYCFHYQISARLSTPAKGLLFWTWWNALSRVMLLLSTVLVLYLLYAD